MHKPEYNQSLEEKVAILTDGERIEGTLFYMGGTRLSDFLNSPNQQEFKFVKIKDPTVYCRRSGEELGRVSFLMVARDRIVMVMTNNATDAADPGPHDMIPQQRGREPSARFLR